MDMHFFPNFPVDPRCEVRTTGGFAPFAGQFTKPYEDIPEGYVLFESRDRAGFQDQMMILQHVIQGKSIYLDTLMEIHKDKESKRYSKIVLFDVDLFFLKNVLTGEDSVVVKDWNGFEKAMNFGWRYHIEGLLQSAINYANNTPLGKDVERQSDLASRLMRQFRFRVSAEAQAKLLDIILKFQYSEFENPGALITQSFSMMADGGFDHVMKPTKIDFPMRCNEQSRFVSSKEPKLTCCSLPRPFNPSRSKIPMYCSKCEQILCMKCQRRRCFSRLMSFIQYTYYIRMHKTKARAPRTTRRPFEAIGTTFPHAEFDSLEDSFLFKMENEVSEAGNEEKSEPMEVDE